jgi:translation elongation factor EF-Ts
MEKAVTSSARSRGREEGGARGGGRLARCDIPAGDVGALVEVNCETDFVARTDKFVNLTQSLVALVGADPEAADVATLVARRLDGRPVADVVKELIGSIGENIVVRRAARLALPAGAKGLVASYLHAGGKIGVLMGIRCASEQAAKAETVTKLAKDLALQVCSAEPAYVTRDECRRRSSSGAGDPARSPTSRGPRRFRTRSSRGGWRSSTWSAAW